MFINLFFQQLQMSTFTARSNTRDTGSTVRRQNRPAGSPQGVNLPGRVNEISFKADQLNRSVAELKELVAQCFNTIQYMKQEFHNLQQIYPKIDSLVRMSTIAEDRYNADLLQRQEWQHQWDATPSWGIEPTVEAEHVDYAAAINEAAHVEHATAINNHFESGEPGRLTPYGQRLGDVDQFYTMLVNENVSHMA